MSDGFQIDLASAIAQLPKPPAEQYVIVYGHGTFRPGLYAPRGVDDQTPHTRDEAYVVVKGSGQFVCGDSAKRSRRVSCSSFRAGSDAPLRELHG